MDKIFEAFGLMQKEEKTKAIEQASDRCGVTTDYLKNAWIYGRKIPKDKAGLVAQEFDKVLGEIQGKISTARKDLKKIA